MLNIGEIIMRRRRKAILQDMAQAGVRLTERRLRATGMSRRQAKTAISQAKESASTA